MKVIQKRNQVLTEKCNDCSKQLMKFVLAF